MFQTEIEEYRRDKHCKRLINLLFRFEHLLYLLSSQLLLYDHLEIAIHVFVDYCTEYAL